MYHNKVWAWRFYYYLREYHILGYPGSLIDQPDSYFYDIATIEMVRQYLKQSKSVPRMEQRSIFEKLRSGEDPFRTKVINE